MAEQLAAIQNSGTDRLRTAVMRRATVLLAAAVVAAVAAVASAGQPVIVREGLIVPLALAALVAAGYLIRAALEYLETPCLIEYSYIVFFVRYPRGPFLGLSWSEISSVMPVKTRYRLLGETLYDLKLSVLHKKDQVIPNLSLGAGRVFIQAFSQYSKRLPPEEAEKASNEWFDIKRF